MCSSFSPPPVWRQGPPGTSLLCSGAEGLLGGRAVRMAAPTLASAITLCPEASMVSSYPPRSVWGLCMCLSYCRSFLGSSGRGHVGISPLRWETSLFLGPYTISLKKRKEKKRYACYWRLFGVSTDSSLHFPSMWFAQLNLHTHPVQVSLYRLRPYIAFIPFYYLSMAIMLPSKMNSTDPQTTPYLVK